MILGARAGFSPPRLGPGSSVFSPFPGVARVSRATSGPTSLSPRDHSNGVDYARYFRENPPFLEIRRWTDRGRVRGDAGSDRGGLLDRHSVDRHASEQHVRVGRRGSPLGKLAASSHPFGPRRPRPTRDGGRGMGFSSIALPVWDSRARIPDGCSRAWRPVRLFGQGTRTLPGHAIRASFLGRPPRDRRTLVRTAPASDHAKADSDRLSTGHLAMIEDGNLFKRDRFSRPRFHERLSSIVGTILGRGKRRRALVRTSAPLQPRDGDWLPAGAVRETKSAAIAAEPAAIAA